MSNDLMELCDNLVLLYDNILVKEDEPETMKGLIIIPDSAQKPARTGLVLAIGHGRLSRMTDEVSPLVVKKGDRIRFNDFTFTEVKIGKEKVLHMREPDLLWIEKRGEK